MIECYAHDNYPEVMRLVKAQHGEPSTLVDAKDRYLELLELAMSLESRLTKANNGEAFRRLRELATALDSAFISTWQTTAAWQKQLDAALEYLNAQH